MIPSQETWNIREAVGDDLDFIYSTWMRSYRYDSEIGECRNSIFFPEYNKVIDNILSQPDTMTRVACKYDEPNIVFGYAVAQPGILHYVFVKHAFVKMGIARTLIAEFGALAYVTHKTFSTSSYISKHNLDYNPFLLFKRGIENGNKSEGIN